MTKKVTAILLALLMGLSSMITVVAEEANSNAATEAIIENPAEITARVGESAIFSVKTVGDVRSYQWQVSKNGGKKWTDLNPKTYGATNTLRIEAKKSYDGYLYRCEVTFTDYSVAYSEEARLSVLPTLVSESVALDQLSVGAEYDSEVFSEPVSLGADLLVQEDERYAEAVDALNGAGISYEKLMALDIHFLSQANGQEVEPNGEVDISIEIDKALLGEDVDRLSITISHITEDGLEVISGGVSDAPIEDVETSTLKINFKANSFSTYTISWNYWGNHSHTINYVDTSGNSVTPTMTPTFTNTNMYLIYDVEGYEYDSCHLGSLNGTAIRPRLRINSGDREYMAANNSWQDLRNNIYVVYKPKATPTMGGTPEIDHDDETWPEGNDAPQFGKSSTNNGDGTNTIALTIVAGEKPIEKSTPADVIIIFDISGSMNDNMNGGTATAQNPSRLSLAKTATKTMAETLLANSGVRLALISFSNTATVEQGFTSNLTTFNNKVDGLNAAGGTNWERALYLANSQSVRSDAATFVVFVTDGDPTFRMTRGNVADSDLDISNDYYRDYNVFGQGNSDNAGRNLAYAVDQVAEIKTAKKDFYAIGISTAVTKVQNLTTQGGYDANHAFIASDNAAMQTAFSSITESIKSALGFGDVEITDGITELSNTEMKVMHTVDASSFKYYRYGGEGNKYGADEAHKTEWTTREEDGCGAASYSESDGAVHWNMGEGFQLENGVTYVVTFRVWPSQEAYDLVADLNNGIKSYDSLSAEEKSQIVEVTAVPSNYYALKTNTDNVNATYSQTTKTGETVTVTGEQGLSATYHQGTLEDMNLESMKLTIKKEFEDDLTAGEDRETSVTLRLLRRNAHTEGAQFEPYPVPQQGGTVSADIVLNEANNWSYEVYIAPGFEVDGEVLEHGYEFTLVEPNIDYHYSLIEEVINPMVVNGVDTFYGDGFLIDDQQQVAEYKDESLSAVNRVKSGIDIKKVLLDPYGQEILPDVEFTIKGQLLGPDGNPFTFDPAWDDRTDQSTGDGASATWQAHQNDTGAYHKYDKNGTRTIYKGHFDSTENIEFTLKPGEYIRFVNVPEGCTFEFYEVIPEGDAYEWYEWVSTKAVTQHRTSPGGPFTTDGDIQPIVEDGKAILVRDLENNLTGVVGNKQYSVTFTNKTDKGEWFYVYHSSDNTVEQIFVTDERVTVTQNEDKVTYTFNIVDETKEGFLYGGYYKAYSGAALTDAEIAAETYTVDANGKYWFTDTEGAPYTAAKANVWIGSEAYTSTVDAETGTGGTGTAMTVAPFTVYYLKEVPNGYIRPYIHYTYDDYDPAKPIKKLYVITAADDTNYTNVGYVLSTETTLTAAATRSLTISIKKPDGTLDALLTAKGIFNGKTYQDGAATVTRGYLYWSDVTTTIGIGKAFTYRPTWETLDGVQVGGFTVRTVNGGTSGDLKSENAIGVSDVAP